MLKATDKEEPIPRALIRLAFLTGCRGGELRKSEWSWVDFNEKLLRLPSEATKGAASRDVVLVRQGMKVLRDLKKRTGGGRYLFPGGTEGEHLATAEKIVKRIRTRSNVSFTLHDVRDAVANFVGVLLPVRTPLPESPRVCRRDEGGDFRLNTPSAIRNRTALES